MPTHKQPLALKHVKIQRTPEGRYNIVTAFLGNVLGPRLIKSCEPWPAHESANLTMAEAHTAAPVFDAYLERQQPNRKRP